MTSENVENWMRQLYKPERFRNEPGFNCDREQRLIADREKDILEQGFAIISHHDSVTGCVEFIGKIPAWVRDPSTIGFTRLVSVRLPRS